MSIYELLPLSRNGLARRRQQRDPFYALQSRTNHLFDDFFDGFGLEPFSRLATLQDSFVPSVNVTEDEKEIVVSTELPGIDQKDVELSLDDGILTIKGQKKQQQENKDENCYRMERSYGSFERRIGLPSEVDRDKSTADFKKGVLTIHLPKIEQEKLKAKKIDIKSN